MTKESLEVRQSLRRAVPIARAIRRGDSIVPVYHRDEKKLGRRYLSRQGISDETLDTVFSPDGRWNPQRPNLEKEKVDIYNMPLDELGGVKDEKTGKLIKEGYLDKVFGPLYEMIDPSLDGSYDYGYNRHSREHAQFVRSKVRELLEGAHQPEDVIRRAMIAASIHDLGNIFSRTTHTHLSPRIAKTVMPELLEDPDQWQVIRQAVTLHETYSLLRFVDPKEEMDPDEIVEAMQKKCSPELLALVIADKVDFGRPRVSTKEDNPLAADYDDHTQVNLLGRFHQFELINLDYYGQKQKVIWDVVFNPIMSDEELSAFHHFEDHATRRSAHDGFRAKTGKKISSRYKNEELAIPQFQTWENLYWSNVALSRTFVTIEAAFALFPKVEKLSLSFIDPYMNPETEEREAYNLTDENVTTSHNMVRGGVTHALRHIYLVHNLKEQLRLKPNG